MKTQKTNSETQQGNTAQHSEKAKSTRRKLTEMFVNYASEIVKLYSSVYRVRNYVHSQNKDEKKAPKQGEDRMIRQYSKVDWLNPFTPKISHVAYTWLKDDEELWEKYQKDVLHGDIVEQQKATFVKLNQDYIQNGKTKPTYLRIIHNLESSWLFHRAHHKLFNDYHTKVKTFLELDAFLITHTNQFFMRKFLYYLEGNYVVSLRGTGKVYVPHLQAPLDSVDLAYSSYYGLANEHLVTDYFEKTSVKNTRELLDEYQSMIDFEAHTTQEEGRLGKIFLRCSQYVDQDVYHDMFKSWLETIGNQLPEGQFNDRETVRKVIKNLVEADTLKIHQKLYKKESPEIADLRTTYEDDHQILVAVEKSEIRRLLRTLFVAMIEYSINRVRMEPRGGAVSAVEKTEYETIFREYKDMTLLEQRLNCLLVEDGEVSFVLMLSYYIQKTPAFPEIQALLGWGLIEKESADRFVFSPRARRMTKWVAKIAAMNLSCKNKVGELKLSYGCNKDVRDNYDPLSKEADSLFHWIRRLRFPEKLQSLLSEIAFSEGEILTEKDMIFKFGSLCYQCLDGKDPEHKETVKSCVTKKSRFNRHLNEFLRRNETISRSVVAVPISTIPTELEGLADKIYGFSIFIGTFNFPEGLDEDKKFPAEMSEREEVLRAIKTYFTLIGKPASEALNRFFVENESATRVANALGKSAHALKNEGLSFRTKIDTLKNAIESETDSPAIHAGVAELEKAYERLSGAIRLLNLSSNPFQAQYLDKRHYCLMDILLRAYCNSFDQFYLSGPENERKRFRIGDSGMFKSPILRITVKNECQTNPYSLVDVVAPYYPNLPKIKFDHRVTPRLDARSILKAEQVFKDMLPDRLILQSAYFEMFNNALQYCNKDTESVYIDLELIRREDEIIVKIANTTSLENIKRLKSLTIKSPEKQSQVKGAGVDTNVLFFRNIGGEFWLDEDHASSKVIATSRINLQFLRNV